MTNNIGKKITLLMERHDVSYRDIENKTGIPKSALQRYASGTTESVPIDRVKIIADFFNVEPAYLSGWQQDNVQSNDSSSRNETLNMLTPNDNASNVYGDHAANLEYFKDKPELLKTYKNIHESESLQLLFDSARDLSPEDLESVLIHIQGIRKARGLD